MCDPTDLAVLKVPLRGLYHTINYSATSIVYPISHAIALKTPIKYRPFRPDSKVTEKNRKFYARISKESIESIEDEKKIYEIIDRAPPHPNVFQSLLCVPQGIFLPHMVQTLEQRIKKGDSEPITSETRYRWAKELSRAMAWLETLEVVHGDLRPVNIFLDAKEEIKVGDFNCSTHPGLYLKSFTDPYWMAKADGSLNKAGPKTEQFALGTCLFFIFNGFDPKSEGDATMGPRHDEQLLSDRSKLGHITRKCWDGAYGSMAEVAAELEREPSDKPWNVYNLLRGLYKYTLSFFSPRLGFSTSAAKDQRLALRAFCEDYVHQHAIDYEEDWDMIAANEKP
ncbi:MAG: hypothetical protein M1835_006976 [Candelina submexicana]|nr:MAG: hypothetical protein M1835_006976 [Candelina submexicana]